MSESVIIMGYLAGIYMVWNIEANYTPNGMASTVAANVITLRQSVLIGGLLDFIGAAFAGSHVISTICSGIVNSTAINSTR